VFWGSHRWLPGAETFILACEIPWPLSIFLTAEQLAKYQIIFRHNFHYKHVQLLLSDCWIHHQQMKGYTIAPLLNSFTLRAKMGHFIHTFISYNIIGAIESSWSEFSVELEKVDSASLAKRLSAPRWIPF
jgi:gamma-tubulin complex component 2